MVRATASLAAKIGKGLATPAAPSTTTAGKSKDFFREVPQICAGFCQSWCPDTCIIVFAISACTLQVCRILPWTVSNYKLDELITVRELRRNIAEQFQQHSKVTSPQVNIKHC